MACNDSDMATLLLEADADLRAVDGDGCDAFDHAVDSRDGSILETLLASLGSNACCARVNRRDNATGGTLLMRARSSGHVRALLDAGAVVRAVDNAGRDAFVHAGERLAAEGDSGVLRGLRYSLRYEGRLAVSDPALQALGVTGRHWGK